MSSNSYKLNSATHGAYPGGYPAYSTGSYNSNQHEMTEYNGGGSRHGGPGSGNHYSTGSGSKKQHHHHHYPQHHHQRSGSVSHSAAHYPPVNHGPSVAGGGHLDDEEDEYDRGHWGSKAEFILSCIGYSVSCANSTVTVQISSKLWKLLVLDFLFVLRTGFSCVSLKSGFFVCFSKVSNCGNIIASISS